jgi:DNA-binding transcriptional MerR regulator
MKIGELAQRAETPATTIRYYESLGLLKRPPRQSGRRVYDQAVVAQLRAIAALRYAGFTLAEIRELVPVMAAGRTPGARWQRAAQAKLEQLDDTICELGRARQALSRAIHCTCGGDPSACEFVASARSAGSHGRRQQGNQNPRAHATHA